MLEIQLPIFPVSRNAITSELVFEQREGLVFYFNGHLPVFTHPVADIASFRFFTSQHIDNSSASQSQISKALGVPLIAVKRFAKNFASKVPVRSFARPPRQGTQAHSGAPRPSPSPAHIKFEVRLHLPALLLLVRL